MTRKERITLKALASYGRKAQLLMLIEEVEELVVAMKSGDREQIVEEVADVAICAQYPLYIFGMEDDSWPEDPSLDRLHEIASDVRFFICRASRGRPVHHQSVWSLSGWLQAWAIKNDAVDEIKTVSEEKLLRLEKRVAEGCLM